MHFKFNTTLNDQDYLDYNIFLMTKSPYGKKQITKFRIVLALVYTVLSLLYLLTEDFSVGAWVGAIFILICLVLFELLLNKFFIRITKGQIKSLKKKGKMPYSPVADMEFYDEVFIETTPENKTEQKYSSIEKVSIITDKIIYIHVNNLLAYIIPLNCFNSKEEYNDFISFIKTKCQTIDVYE